MITHTRSLPALALLLVALFALPIASTAATVQAWLLVSGAYDDSIISTDPKERDQLEKGGWVVNGTGNLQLTPEKGTANLHRLFRSSKEGADRVLEANPAKLAALVKQGYTDEGGLGLVSVAEQAGLVPVHHFTKGERHLWLINKSAQPAAEAKGWKSAGVSFWMWPVAAKPAAAPKSVTPPAKAGAKTPAK